MLDGKVNFERVCGIVKEWKWCELKAGLEKKIISKKEIILYAYLIISEDTEHFARVIELSIAEEEEVEDILSELVLKEEKKSIETINSKWIFAIIYDAYIYLGDKVYDVIEDVYAEFEYPDEISNLVKYMPCIDNRPLNVKLDEYIEINKRIFDIKDEFTCMK